MAIFINQGKPGKSAWLEVGHQIYKMGKYIIAGKTLKEWSVISGLSVRLIRSRLKDHYDIDRLFDPKKKKQVPRGSIKQFVESCANEQGVTRKAIYMRLLRGWSAEEVKRGYRDGC